MVILYDKGERLRTQVPEGEKNENRQCQTTQSAFS